MRAATLLPCLLLAGCIPPKSSKDYSVPFARSYWATPAAQRPTLSSLTMEQLYSLNQYGRRAFHPWRTMAPAFGCRGAAAVPYLKTKIAPKTVGGLLETLAWMRRMEAMVAAPGVADQPGRGDRWVGNPFFSAGCLSTS